MPKIQRSPPSGQKYSSDTDIPSGSHDDTAQEYVGRRQKRRMVGSPPAATDDTDMTSVMSEFRQEFASCIMEMREFRKEMAQLRESFTAVAARLDCVEKRIDALEQRQSSDRPEGAAELERTITQLRLELNDRDQEALLSDLELGQLPEEKGENVMHTVTVLAARLGVTLDERDVVFAERVGAPPSSEGGGRPRRVVLRLTRRHLRDELLRAARVRRSAAVGAAGGRVFVNERLTRPNRQLFHRAREECRKCQWRYSWTKRGRIFVRKGDGTPVFQLRSDEDLVRLFGPREI